MAGNDNKDKQKTKLKKNHSNMEKWVFQFECNIKMHISDSYRNIYYKWKCIAHLHNDELDNNIPRNIHTHTREKERERGRDSEWAETEDKTKNYADN